MDTYELIRRGERELADGDRSARKTLERARRELLKQGDVQGLDHLLELASRLEDRGDLTYAIQQNLRFLHRRAQARSGTLSAPTPTPKPAGPKSFLFGDPGRPRSLALAWIASIVMFPVFWFGLLILYGLGGGNEPTTDQEIQHAERVILVIAAIPSALGIVAATLDWLGARRSHPPETRKALLSPEGIWSAAAVLAILGAAVALGVWLWNTYI